MENVLRQPFNFQNIFFTISQPAFEKANVNPLLLGPFFVLL